MGRTCTDYLKAILEKSLENRKKKVGMAKEEEDLKGNEQEK